MKFDKYIKIGVLGIALWSLTGCTTGGSGGGGTNVYFGRRISSRVEWRVCRIV